MAYRHIIIRNPAKLSVRNNQLIIKQENSVQIPLEDICTLTIEDPAITLTGVLLSQCAAHNVELIVCDQKRIPSATLQPFHQHSRQKAVLDMQIGLSKPFKKRIWQKVVQAKIENQARCLELTYQSEEADVLYTLSKQVESGDRTNKEAYAAKYYFNKLFGDQFTRRRDDPQNIALNYGYSLIRSLVARALVRYGFMPSLGIFHDSQTNAFNLADDFMEPLRPFVDYTVATYVKGDTVWDSEIKEKLFRILSYSAYWKGEKQSITNGVDWMVKSYVAACRNGDPKFIVLPELKSLELHVYE
ncbi:type II CRISPR-associated endonuclease Cas1 [Gracilibacillus alcaliphilus]|uniref:type II CRISPR-associated endonuclease Cas1 n=1 Tax=Gracilibacillus alcaliphilus TaxID=1401441 RepID=UPI001959994C|nr:type II CRISPR-associated endonuclease Cas1 [Gracilibacillus alcaliphilus]MBM7676564.1 CRISPR-associated protein Cas1 [Gracilibacillus alcaliphilus]